MKERYDFCKPMENLNLFNRFEGGSGTIYRMYDKADPSFKVCVQLFKKSGLSELELQ